MSTRPKRTPRNVRIPLIGGGDLHKLFATQLHVSTAALRMAPAPAHFDSIAQILNVVGLAVASKPALSDYRVRINSGANAMNQIANKVQAIGAGAQLTLHEHELQPVELAAAAADDVLPRLTVDELYAALKTVQRAT